MVPMLQIMILASGELQVYVTLGKGELSASDCDEDCLELLLTVWTYVSSQPRKRRPSNML